MQRCDAMPSWYRALAIALLATGCAFDSSTSATGPSHPPAPGGLDAAPLSGGCDSFEGATCNDCGIEVCEVVDGQLVVFCQGQGSCESEGSCTADGHCEQRCEEGAIQVCGTCGVSTCQAGQWSECVAQDSSCESDEVCIASGSGFECMEGCSTEGRSQVCEGSQEVPGHVEFGDTWSTASDCVLEGRCRSCTCSRVGGRSVVLCDPLCSVPN